MYTKNITGSGSWTSKAKARLNRAIARTVATAIRKNAKEMGHTCKVLHSWAIDLSYTAKNAKYPHLIVLTSICLGVNATTKLIKIEFDDCDRSPMDLMKGMIRSSGYAVVLCPEGCRFNKHISAYRTLEKTDMIVTDGIFFGMTEEVLQNGIMGTTFTALDGARVRFEPL